MRTLHTSQRDALGPRQPKKRTWYLTSSSCPDFSLIVLQQLNEVADELLPDKFLTNNFRQLSSAPLNL